MVPSRYSKDTVKIIKIANFVRCSDISATDVSAKTFRPRTFWPRTFRPMDISATDISAMEKYILFDHYKLTQ